MNTVRRIAKNSGASLLSQIANPACSFILALFIARKLGVNEFGKFSAVLSLFYVFEAFSSMGFSYLVTREVSQDASKASKYLVNASLIGVIAASIMMSIMWLVANIISDSHDVIQAAYILSIALIPYSLTTVSQSVCRAFERIEYITISEVSANAFKVGLGLFLLYKGYGLVTLMVVIVASHFVMFGVSSYFALKCTPVRCFEFNLELCRWIIKATPVFAIIFILNTVRWNIDILMLTRLMGEREVGFYSAASKLLTIGKMGISCYIVAIQPIIFRLYRTSLEKYRIACEDSIRYLLIMTIPIVLGTILLSDRFIVTVYMNAFLPAGEALSILVWILILSGSNLIFANALVASNNQRINLEGNLISMVLNIILNLLLIPRFSFMGAAIASLSSSVMLIVYQYWSVSKKLFKIDYVRIIMKPSISACAMGVFIVMYKEMNLYALIPISALVYLAAILALKTFTSRDIDYLRELLHGRRWIDVTEINEKGASTL